MANTIRRWNPFSELEDILERYNSQGFPRIGGDNASQDILRKTDWAPAVDISETAESFVIKAELPGVDRKDVKVTVHDGVLMMQGERRAESENKDKKHHRIERFYGSFARSFTLPDNVDEDHIRADYKDGILHLTLAKTEKSKPKAIEVKVN